jgi:hypothetical protein
MLTKISVGYNQRLGKYVVKWHRTHYYFGMIKGYSYIAKEEMYDDLESAKYAIIQNETANKLSIDDEATNALSYTDALKLQGNISNYKKKNDTDYQSD